MIANSLSFTLNYLLVFLLPNYILETCLQSGTLLLFSFCMKNVADQDVQHAITFNKYCV